MARKRKPKRKAIPDSGEVIRLTPAESLAFAKLLLNPPEPNAALKRAAREHRKTVIEHKT